MKSKWARARAGEIRALQARLTLLLADESGMSTVEYAIGTIAAAAFGAILYTVVTGDSVVSALTNIINRALNTNV
ncbi:MAG: hypothetical protein QOD39_2549 [Mycobacterium sp.]|jgi:Flp pilus assembly pilin Flp|nr:hypothetical protein [Mycobacterium sp.]